MFDLLKQSNSAMKVLMSIIRIGIGLARLRPLYEFYKLVLYISRTDPSILQQVLNIVKIASLAVYCARAIRNFWL